MFVDPVHWCIYAAWGGDELTECWLQVLSSNGIGSIQLWLKYTPSKLRGHLTYNQRGGAGNWNSYAVPHDIEFDRTVCGTTDLKHKSSCSYLESVSPLCSIYDKFGTSYSQLHCGDRHSKLLLYPLHKKFVGGLYWFHRPSVPHAVSPL